MCGIAGWVDWETNLDAQAPVVYRMGETLACRGPDAEGLWVSPRAVLAHRRLVVVDPAGGAQPMVRKRGGARYVLSYNGELYNTEEVRAELKALGYTFRGYSDTEVLLVSLMAWGPEALPRLNGIFAFALWDEAGQRLFLARDRLGVKPLFYARRGAGLLFGSELKALLAHPEVEPAVDEEGLAEIFGLGPGRTPGCGVFRGVEELRPGHALEFSPRGLRLWPYWRLTSRPHRQGLAETAATLRDLLRDTVERQLVSDVPVCTFLSGGLDSSAVTAFAAAASAREGKGPLQTYSIDYVDNERFFRPSDFQPNADTPWARRVAAALGTEHHAVLVDTPELMAALTTAVRARDLPGMADIDASLYLFCRAVKEQATVALSGEAADEILGGYPWFRRPDALQARTFPWALQLELRQRILAPPLRQRLALEGYVQERYREAVAEVPRLEGEAPEAARLREIGYLSITRFMPVLLDRKDRMSMAVGLEVRVPYCDHRLVEYAWNIPWEMKRCDGREKGILRRALEGILPPDVLERQKSPYPKTHNPAYALAVREAMRRLLADRESPLAPLLDREAVEALVESDLDARQTPWFGQLMSGPQLLAYLLQVDAWLRLYRVRIRAG